MEAERLKLCSYKQGIQRIPAATRTWEKSMEQILLQAPKGTHPANTLISDFFASRTVRQYIFVVVSPSACGTV